MTNTPAGNIPDHDHFSSRKLRTLADVLDDYHRDICTALQLDPERATTEDVVLLVSGLADALVEMRTKRDRCACQARTWRWWLPRYLLREYLELRRHTA